MPELDHLFVTGYTDLRDFKSPRSARARQSPDRDRTTHGAGLLNQLRNLAVEAESLRALRVEAGVSGDQGFAISLEIHPAGIIDTGKKLEWKKDHIEVLNVVPSGAGEVVTVFVPDGKLVAFERRVREYLDPSKDKPSTREGEPARPRHASLIQAIASFRSAAFTEYWTDTQEIPPLQENHHFTIWLRQGSHTPAEAASTFRHAASSIGIDVEPGHISFPGRVVLAVHASRAQLERSLLLLDLIAEIRLAPPSASFYLSELRPHEQVAWVRDLEARMTVANAAETPYITLLDTGVNRAHPLLRAAIAETDMHAVRGEWLNIDRQGHGSNMAGIALHGDLTLPLSTSHPQTLNHRLESVKILPDHGANPPRLYGWTATEAVRLVEEFSSERKRIFAMMTTATGPTAGMPSEWSASIDRLAFGLRGDSLTTHDLPVVVGSSPILQPRLFIIAAGNIPWNQWQGYPQLNDMESIEDPAQSWNALTVGAYTEQVQVDQRKWPSLHPIAPQGAIAPASRTSVNWSRSWPHKPDVVAEGGNGCLDAAMADSVVVGPEDLRLLTTSHDPITDLLAETGDTSAATAEVARLCARLQQRYPAYWPETIRALAVHGAQYTPAMSAGLDVANILRDRETILRRYGHGRVSPDSTLSSTPRRPVIVMQENIVPYIAEDGDRKLGKLNLHRLPWPAQELERLGAARVALKVTLSYFVQPNPSRRGWQSKFRYQNFGLRFAVRAASETTERFQQRINKIARDEMREEREDNMPDPDNAGWFLRSNLRSRGSLHSDTWTGTATALANKSEIAVFPVGGWWKEMGAALAPDILMRYSLAVSLEIMNDTDVDIYSPIANEIAVSTVIPSV